jgi:hypothetical protein
VEVVEHKALEEVLLVLMLVVAEQQNLQVLLEHLLLVLEVAEA